MGAKGLITVTGSLAQRPHRGGHAWVFLQPIRGDYRKHTLAAREIAEECVASDVVPTSLLDRLGNG